MAWRRLFPPKLRAGRCKRQIRPHRAMAARCLRDVTELSTRRESKQWPSSSACCEIGLRAFRESGTVTVQKTILLVRHRKTSVRGPARVVSDKQIRRSPQNDLPDKCRGGDASCPAGRPRCLPAPEIPSRSSAESVLQARTRPPGSRPLPATRNARAIEFDGAGGLNVRLEMPAG